MSNPENRPLPFLTELTRPFWTSGADGRLRILRCSACELWLHPPTTICSRCLSTDVAYQPVSGRATLHSYTINHQQWYPGPQVPYVVAVVELAEQPHLRLTTNIVNCAIDDLRFDMPVQVLFLETEDVHLPVFEPVVEPDRGATLEHTGA